MFLFCLLCGRCAKFPGCIDSGREVLAGPWDVISILSSYINSPGRTADAQKPCPAIMGQHADSAASGPGGESCLGTHQKMKLSKAGLVFWMISWIS